MTEMMDPTLSATQATEAAMAVVTEAAAAAAEVLPAAEPLAPAGARPGTADLIGAFAAGVVARVDNTGARTTGHVAVLVGADLVEALASSPIGGLDLAAACQPALDAVARTLGGSAAAAQQVDLSLLGTDLGGSFTAVPLAGTGTAAAVLVSDALLPVAAPQDAEPAAAPARPVHHAAGAGAAASPRRGIEMLHGVDMEVTVELGRTRMTVRDLLAMAPGAVLELDRAAGSPADLLVNGRLIARGEVVVVDEDFGLRVTEIVDDRVSG